MKFTSFLIAALTITAFYANSAQARWPAVLTATAVYQNGKSKAVDCKGDVVDVTNISYVQFSFQEQYGTHPLECLKYAKDASSLTSLCNTTNDVYNPVSGPEGWEEFSNSAGYLWTQNYGASMLPTKYNFKVALRMGLVGSEVEQCQFSTVGSSTATIPMPPAPPVSNVPGVFPQDCPIQFSPQPPVGTPCKDLVGNNQTPNFFPNITEYAKQHNIDQTQTRASCAANAPKGSPLCWTDDEKAMFINCVGTYDDRPEITVIFGGYANQQIGVLFNGQPYYLWYRANAPSICQYYVPSPLSANGTASTTTSTPAPVVNPAPAPAPVHAVTNVKAHLGRFMHR